MNGYEKLLDFCDQIKSCRLETEFLEVVMDEDGNEVHIVLDASFAPDCGIKNRSVMAVLPDGTLYPEYADRKVMAKINKHIETWRNV